MTERTIEVKQTDVRGYFYRAIMRRKTGSLVCIQAGCRTWRTFEDANEHYRANQVRASCWRGLGWPRWSDGWILGQTNVELRLAERHSAVLTLRALEADYHAKRNEIRRKRRA